MYRYSVSLVPILCLAHQAAFSQNAEPTQLPKVVATAPSPALETRKELEAEQALIPGGVTLVDSQETQQRQISNLSDLMRFVPGVWSTSSSGGDAMFMSIRGSNLDATNYDMNGVKLLQDGLPVTTADGNNHNRMIDPIAARYATVARGANALTHGASTLGGSIDFTTPTALDSPPLELVLNGGSFGLVQGQFNAGVVSGNFDGMLTLDAKHRDGYRQHSSQERESLYGNVGWQLGSAVRTRFFLSYIDNKEELPGVLTREQWQQDPRQAEAAAVAGNYQVNVETQRVANKTTWDIDANSSLSFGVSYEEQSLFHPIVYSPPFFSLLIDTKQRNVGTSLNYNLRAGEHNVLAGLNYGSTTVTGGNHRHDGGVPTAQAATVDHRADLIEFFAVDRWNFAPRWTAVYGAQAIDTSRDVRTTDLLPPSAGTVTNPKGDYHSINPRVGLVHEIAPEVQLYTNLSRLYEPPTNYQLQYSDGTLLDAMHGNVIELGSRGTALVDAIRWRWDVSAYYARIKDEILSEDDGAPGGTGRSINFDKTVHAGIEALVGASFPLDGSGQRLEPLVNLTLNRFKFDNDPQYGNNRLPAAPNYSVRAELLYRNAAGFFFGPTFDFIGQRYADFSNTYKVDGYNLFGLRAGLSQKTWEVFGEIRNLGDKNYIAYHSVKDRAGAGDAVLYPGEPRSLYVGARLRF